MSGTTEALHNRVEMLLAKAVLERQFVSAEALRDALAEKSQSVARGRQRPRALGAILIEKGALDALKLAQITDELEARALEEELLRRQDAALGALLVERAKALPSQVERCLRLQEEAFDRSEGPLPRLEELLVQENCVGEIVVSHALKILERTVRVCLKCSQRTNWAGLVRCPGCDGALERLDPVDRNEDWPTEAPLSPSGTTPSSADAAGETQAAPSVLANVPETLGKYKLLRTVGRGGMGVVHEALDVQLKRRVALKIMLTSANADSEEVKQEVERFIREAQVAAKLSHPNIVTVYEAGVIDGKNYIAMEFVDGQSLASWARKSGSVTIRQQVRLLRDVALAVHHAHEEGVLHRDLKPMNVLVDGKNQPFVTDFGLAKQMGKDVDASLTLSGKIVGTPAYMSPEQALGEKVDRRTDVYSLGCMLYEVLTGRPPYRGESPVEILTKVLRDDIPTPSHLGRTLGMAPVDRTVEAICMKALARKPSGRYPTASAFAEDLTKWLKGHEVKVSIPAGGRKLPRRAVPLAGAAAVVLAVALAAVVILRPSPLERELKRADRLLAQGAYRDAIEAYKDVLALDPRSGRALMGREFASERLHTEALGAAIEEEKWAEDRVKRAREVLDELKKTEAATLPGEHQRQTVRRRQDAEKALKAAEDELRKKNEILLRLLPPKK